MYNNFANIKEIDYDMILWTIQTNIYYNISIRIQQVYTLNYFNNLVLDKYSSL